MVSFQIASHFVDYLLTGVNDYVLSQDLNSKKADWISKN